MSEEIKKEEKESCCFCKCEFLQRTFAVAIGSFVGVYFALSLFVATHRPPMMFPHFKHHGLSQKMLNGEFKKGKDFHKFRPEDFKEFRKEKAQDEEK